jgi:hypothetical protein
MEGDVILAEPGRRSASRGARHRADDTEDPAEWLPDGGIPAGPRLPDDIVPRGEQKERIAALLRLHAEGAAHDGE